MFEEYIDKPVKVVMNEERVRVFYGYVREIESPFIKLEYFRGDRTVTIRLDEITTIEQIPQEKVNQFK